jgi:methylenetetrahydrofolate--tRNA-(uracil-5-)-methyltransferase
LRYITDPTRKHFQPMNANFGLMAPLTAPFRAKAKKEMMARRALTDMEAWIHEIGRKEAQQPANSRILPGKAIAG